MERKVVKLKTSFEVGDKLEAFYKGGPVQLSKDGQHLFATCENAIKVVSYGSGRVEHSVEEEEDHVTSFAVGGDGRWLVVGWRSLLLKQYCLDTYKCTRSWKGHVAPVMSMAFDSSSTLLATGSSNSVVNVWDLDKQYCTHNLRGCGGVVNLVRFHHWPNDPSDPGGPGRALRLLTCSMADCHVRVWDLASSRCVMVLKSHVSPVTSLGFSSDGKTLLSGGRDQLVHVWDLTTGEVLKTIPVFECVEGLVVLPDSVLEQEGPVRQALSSAAQRKKPPSVPLICFTTAGSKGVVRVWSTHRPHPLHALEPLVGPCAGEEEEEEGEGPTAASYTGLHYSESLQVVVAVTYDHNVVCFDAQQFHQVKQFVGHLDEVLDLRLVGGEEGLLVVATNSEQVKVFECSSLSCRLLSGHGRVVLCLDASPDGSLLVTSSKDGSVRLWRLEGGSATQGEEEGEFTCMGVGTGHTHAVGAVAFSRVHGHFVMSGSQDCTLKLWSLKGALRESRGGQAARLKVKYTQLAHDKDINSLDVSPNDKLAVSASQDKTAKLWQVSDGRLVGTFRGHRRGVWSARFSPVDQCVLTASGDSTVKLWAIGDFSCIKTFEGHTNSVLKAVFLSRGMQIASSGSDGLVKIWTIKSNECVATLDQHTEKIWSLTSSSDGETLISGGADSVICLWKDVTERVESEAAAERELQLLREQELSNLLQQKDYVRAVGVAITLDQPNRILKILQEILEKEESDEALLHIVEGLREDQLGSILKYVSRWNQNGRHSHAAQSVLATVLKQVPPEKLLETEDLRSLLEGLIPYTERHFQRLLRLEQLSKFVEYTVQCVKLPAIPEADKAAPLSPTQITAVGQDHDHVTAVPADSTASLEETIEEDDFVEPGDHVTSTTDSIVVGVSDKSAKRRKKAEQKFLAARRRAHPLLSSSKWRMLCGSGTKLSLGARAVKRVVRARTKLKRLRN